MASKSKTWSELTGELAETFRKWRQNQPSITNTLSPRQRGKRFHNETERTVQIAFTFYDRKNYTYRPITLTVKREDDATANLELIAKAVEHVRMAESRGLTQLIVFLYQQMYPAPAVAPPPPPPKQAASSGPYATLHIANDAPLEVAEAAWKAMIRLYHPDLGGSTERAQQINAAIEQIRKEKAR